ncbi:hypothetical protein Ahy_B06g081454 [Arachis hypogaea]|uniref:DUF223 domain-containing protein n=1 Tax=Arachis hypogaea TaxID=3818 RepID=A0A444YL58_ARAHY|nr:hypothetical protein Ahy_B06g081454 [Arachis hypogaea]
MYVMSNFIVVDKMEKVNTTTNRWTINFSNRTRVFPIVHPSYPLEAFCFQPISEFLAADKLDDSILIDVIGEVVGKEDSRKMITSKGKETKRLTILIEDLENNSIGCVLFEEMVDQILPHLEEERVEPLIIIAQFFRPRRRLSGKPSGSARIIQVFSHGPSSGIDELKKGDVVVKIVEDALKSTQARRTYMNCWYKVEVMAYDGTGSITLLKWDKENVQLCGKQANQIKNEVAKESESYPPTLDGMMDRKLLFKVNIKTANIKQYNQVYTVIKICDDEEIVEMNHSKEMHNATSATITETGYSDSIDMSTVVVNRKNDTNSMLSLDGVEKSVTSLKCKIPAKRASIGTKQALPINHDNEDEMGFLTNKFTRKNGKR